MNLYSNILYFHLSKEDKFQSKGVDQYLLDTVISQPKQRKIFHVDCAYTKKKVCYCKYSEAELMPKKEKAFYEARIEFLEEEFKGKDQRYFTDIHHRRQFFKEKIQNFQEPEDLSFYMSYFDDPATVAASADKTVKEENSPKKQHVEGNARIENIGGAGNPNQNQFMRRRNPENDVISEQTRLRRKKENEDEQDSMCYFEKCKNPSGNEEFLSCQKCMKTFHPKCCSPPLSKKIVDRFPWYCNDCKLCFVCKSQGDENKMIICDMCDRAFHSDCLTPKLNEIPKGDWYCPECKKCKSCTAPLTKEPGFPNIEKNLWNDEHLLCSSCIKRFKNNEYCPVCYTIVDDEEDGNYINCDQCNLWVHAECDGMNDKQFKAAIKASYMCPLCRSKV